MRAALMALDRFTTAIASGMAQLLLALCVACGFYQVLSRFVLNQPSDWTEVLTRFMLIWMVYLGTAVAIRTGALVSVEVLYNMSKGRWRVLLEAVITMFSLGFLGILAWFGFVVAWRVRFQNVAGLEVSMQWAYLAIPVGAIFSMIAVIAHFYDPQRRELENAT